MPPSGGNDVTHTHTHTAYILLSTLFSYSAAIFSVERLIYDNRHHVDGMHGEDVVGGGMGDLNFKSIAGNMISRIG